MRKTQFFLTAIFYLHFCTLALSPLFSLTSRAFAQSKLQIIDQQVTPDPAWIDFAITVIPDGRITQAVLHIRPVNPPDMPTQWLPIAVIPIHNPGESVHLETRWALPSLSSAPSQIIIAYQWEFTLDNQFSSITSERQQVIASEKKAATRSPFTFGNTQFESLYPDGIQAVVSVIPTHQITGATFIVTMDEHTTYSSAVNIPPHQTGESVQLSSRWDGITITGESCPPWMQIKAWWQVTDSAGNAFTTASIPFIYADDTGRAWQRDDGIFATIYSYEQDMAFRQAVTQTADTALQTLATRYGYELPYRPVLVFYNSAADGDGDSGQNGQLPFGEFVGARTYPGTNGLVILANQSMEHIRNMIWHEIAHLYQLQIGQTLFDAPPWWLEGDARAHQPDIQNSLDFVRSKSALPDLNSWTTVPTSKTAYDDMAQSGATFVYFLWETYGTASYQNFYRAWGNRRGFYAAFESTYGQSLDVLMLAWQSWLRQ